MPQTQTQPRASRKVTTRPETDVDQDPQSWNPRILTLLGAAGFEAVTDVPERPARVAIALLNLADHATDFLRCVERNAWQFPTAPGRPGSGGPVPDGKIHTAPPDLRPQHVLQVLADLTMAWGAVVCLAEEIRVLSDGTGDAEEVATFQGSPFHAELHTLELHAAACDFTELAVAAALLASADLVLLA